MTKSVEPVFVAQSFDPVHTDNIYSRRQWFTTKMAVAKGKGATWFRLSSSSDMAGLLFEGWEVKPRNEGEQRWKGV